MTFKGDVITDSDEAGYYIVIVLYLFSFTTTVLWKNTIHYTSLSGGGDLRYIFTVKCGFLLK